MSAAPPQLSFDPSSIPIAQLESLKFKANQIIESIQALQRTIEAGNQKFMPAWPDVLSKYNVLLSQSHSFSSSLLQSAPSQQNRGVTVNASSIYERIALHPSLSLTDPQLDNDLIPLLRNQQTTDVLKMENDTVRRLSEHMATRGSLGVLGIPPSSTQTNQKAIVKTEYDDVLRECNQIRDEHDRRVERAVRAVTMLRDKFEWKQRVEVEIEEPEELDWDPRLGPRNQNNAENSNGDVEMDTPDGDGEEGQSSDEEAVEEELVNSMEYGTAASTPTPVAMQVADMERENAPSTTVEEIS